MIARTTIDALYQQPEGLAAFLQREPSSVMLTLNIAREPFDMAKSGKPVRNRNNASRKLARQLVAAWVAKWRSAQ